MKHEQQPQPFEFPQLITPGSPEHFTEISETIAQTYAATPVLEHLPPQQTLQQPEVVTSQERDTDQIDLSFGKSKVPHQGQNYDTVFDSNMGKLYGVLKGIQTGEAAGTNAKESSVAAATAFVDSYNKENLLTGIPDIETAKTIAANALQAGREAVVAAKENARTTATFLKLEVIDDETHVIWANAGSNRLYLLDTGGELTRLTQSHGRGNQMKNYLGKNADTATDDIGSAPLVPGDRLALITDATCRINSEDEIKAILTSSLAAENSSEEAAAAITAQSDTYDDRTAIVLDINDAPNKIFVAPEPEPEPEQEPEHATQSSDLGMKQWTVPKSNTVATILEGKRIQLSTKKSDTYRPQKAEQTPVATDNTSQAPESPTIIASPVTQEPEAGQATNAPELKKSKLAQLREVLGQGNLMSRATYLLGNAMTSGKRINRQSLKELPPQKKIVAAALGAVAVAVGIGAAYKAGVGLYDVFSPDAAASPDMSGAKTGQRLSLPTDMFDNLPDIEAPKVADRPPAPENISLKVGNGGSITEAIQDHAREKNVKLSDQQAYQIYQDLERRHAIDSQNTYQMADGNRGVQDPGEAIKIDNDELADELKKRKKKR